jgi:AcrR family transcriptional regulator
MSPHDTAQVCGDERPARQRILDAAIARFAEHGVAGTSLRVIAEQAGVSQGLIVHHFESKDGLRDACDAEVLGVIRDQMRTAAAEGGDLDVLAAFRRRQQAQAHALPYLARALSEGGAAAVTLVDDLAEETLRSMEQGVADGTYVRTSHPRERALVLLIWSLGAVTLHEHVKRLLGADLTGEPAALLPYLRGATELLTDGLFSDDLRDSVRDAVARLEQEG